jgi:hypothetical protein
MSTLENNTRAFLLGYVVDLTYLGGGTEIKKSLFFSYVCIKKIKKLKFTYTRQTLLVVVLWLWL